MELAHALPDAAPAGDPAHLRRLRVRLPDGAETTLHVARYRRDAVVPEVRVLRRPQPLEAWCGQEGVADAIVGGFFVRRNGVTTAPLGEVRVRGLRRRTVPFDAPWDGVRACLHVHGGAVSIARRDDLPEAPRGDLLQAGPLLVRDGAVVDGDHEGFSAGSRQFDSDITLGRYPRAAIGVTEDEVLAVACDGRAAHDAGLTIAELADALARLGCTTAMNLDGGGSTSLVCDGVLRNVPREEHGIALAAGRPVATAIVLRRAATARA